MKNKFRYRVHNSHTPDPTMTLMKAVHTGYRVHNSRTPDPTMTLMKAVHTICRFSLYSCHDFPIFSLQFCLLCAADSHFPTCCRQTASILLYVFRPPATWSSYWRSSSETSS